MRRISKREAGECLMRALEAYIIAVVTERMKREMQEEKEKRNCKQRQDHDFRKHLGYTQAYLDYMRGPDSE